jgi:hypothetical protein
MANEYIDPMLSDEMTQATVERIKQNIRPFKIVKLYSVGLYEGVIHPLLQCGREHKKIARSVCSWCGKVLNANYKTFDGSDSHGICESCAKIEIAKAKGN